MSPLASAFKSPSFKLLTIGILILLLLIPLLMVKDLVRERAATANQVRSSVARDWGGPQTLEGPFVIVPYQIMIRTRNLKLVPSERFAVFLPEHVEIENQVTSKELQRGLYPVTVFDAKSRFSGRFAMPMVRSLKGCVGESLRWCV